MYVPTRNKKAFEVPKLEKIAHEQISKPLAEEEKNKIREICTDKFSNKEISLAQLERFSQEIIKRNYSFQSNHIKDFIEEQIRREVAQEFYKKFKKQFLENGEYISENKAVNREIMKILKLHIRALIGEERIKEIVE